MEKSNVTSFPKGKVAKEKNTIANSLSPFSCETSAEK